ncbi:MAG: glycosyltransferase family 4 protein [Planctomycetota bacterium]
MRIARVLTRLNLGGPARQVMASDPLLVERGHRVRVFTGSSGPGEGSLLRELEGLGVEVVEIPGLRRGLSALVTGGDLRAGARLRRELTAFRPDIVHTHAAKAGALGRRAARRAVPAARRVHTFHGHVLEGYFPAPLSWLLQGVEARLARETHQILAVSGATGADLVRLGVVGHGKVEVVPPGVRLEGLLGLPERRGGRLRDQLSLHPDDVAIGVIGRLAPVKRTVLALDVFEDVALEFPAAHLVVAGDGGERSRVESRRDLLPEEVRGRVHLLGAVQDIGPVHEALDVLLSTSFAEGMPVAMIEAGAAARPVVSTATGGIPELVRNGITGLFGVDREGLAAALASLVGDAERRVEMGRAARERVRSRHSAHALADRLEDVYARMLGSGE